MNWEVAIKVLCIKKAWDIYKDIAAMEKSIDECNPENSTLWRTDLIT